jgi:cell division protein FtsL
MAKNRKNQSAAVRFGPALKAFLLCVLIGGSGVGYVWQKSQIKQLADQVTQREQQYKELSQQNQRLRDHLAKLRSPEQLMERVQKLNLGLARPQPNQVWTLAEPVLTPPATVDAPAQSIASSSETGLAMH